MIITLTNMSLQLNQSGIKHSINKIICNEAILFVLFLLIFSLSSKANVAITATRGCIGVWNYMTGNLKYTLAKNEMGAIVTHAIVNQEGDKIAAAESGEILIWDMETKSIAYSAECKHVLQITLNRKQTKCLIVSSEGLIGMQKGKMHCATLLHFLGANIAEFVWPLVIYAKVQQF